MFANPEWGYQTIPLQPQCNVQDCRQNDRYSIKMYMFTKCTFNNIPQNIVHWFTTNCCIHDPYNGVEGIPFGIHNTGGNTEFFDVYDKLELKQKSKTLYVNFQFYTSERAELYQYFSGFPGVTCERDVSFEKYLDQLNAHKFCLCPVGNGIDCYRIWECLYMGCIPIVQTHQGFNFLSDLSLPIISINNLIVVNPDVLDHIYNNNEITASWDLTKAKLSYWKDRINEKNTCNRG
jgi:hypothetical protein